MDNDIERALDDLFDDGELNHSNEEPKEDSVNIPTIDISNISKDEEDTKDFSKDFDGIGMPFEEKNINIEEETNVDSNFDKTRDLGDEFDFNNINSDNEIKLEAFTNPYIEESSDKEETYETKETVQEEVKEEPIVKEETPIVAVPKEDEPKEEKEPIKFEKDTENHEVGKKEIRIIIYFLIGILIGFLVIHFISSSQGTSAVSCKYINDTDGFKETDEYVIVHKKNKIYTVSGTYSYVAKLPAFNEEVIKRQNEKTQVIANSYGMKGFTHELEVGESSLKITSNYDFKKINFNVVDAIDTTTMPISYVTINSKVTYDDLKSELTKKKYRCVNTK